MRANSTNPDNLGADLSISRILVFNCYARVCMAVCAPATPTFLPKRFFYIILKLCTFHNFQFLLLQLFIFIFFLGNLMQLAIMRTAIFASCRLLISWQLGRRRGAWPKSLLLPDGWRRCTRRMCNKMILPSLRCASC